MEANPFNGSKIKEMILGKEGRASSDSDSYEIVQPDEDMSGDLKNIIASTPKIPKEAKNMILDASAIAKNDKEKKAVEINLALNDIFTKYNKEYGTDLHIDFTSLSKTLVNVADPETRRILELYLSEVFQSIRPILILHMISKLSLAIDYILDPNRLFGGEMTIQDTFIAVEKIMQFIQQLEDMKDEIIVKGSDLELRKIADSKAGDEFDNPESKKAISDFLDLFRKDNGLS